MLIRRLLSQIVKKKINSSYMRTEKKKSKEAHLS
uniref:Uncharacterized protein n=1 Tax=Anguilla anguilla TaxID=7936 RepID=A0A0E9R072_ANGAN